MPSPYLRERHTSLSISFLRVRNWTRLRDLQRRVPPPTHIHRLTRPAIFSLVHQISATTSLYFDYFEEKLSVSIPLFALGFKEDASLKDTSLKDKILTSIILEYLAGDTSPLYDRLFSEGLINTTFGSEYFAGPGYRSVIFSGESRNPRAVSDAIKEEITRLKETGFDRDDFERIRRMHYGRSVMEYNNVDALANDMVACEFEGYHLFDEIDIYKTLTVEDAMARLNEELDVTNSALSVITEA